MSSNLSFPYLPIDALQRRRLKQIAVEEPDDTPLAYQRLVPEPTMRGGENAVPDLNTSVANMQELSRFPMGRDGIAQPASSLSAYRPQFDFRAESVAPTSNPNQPLPTSRYSTNDAMRMVGMDDSVIKRANNFSRGVTQNEQAAIERPITIPTEPKIADHSNEKRGFWDGVGHHLKHGLRGAVLGAAAGGMGGAFVGGIGGTISPKFTDTLQHNMIDEPKYQRNKAIATEDLANQEALIRGVGQRTGYDPTTGQETPEAKARRIQQENIAEDNRHANESFKSEQDIRQRQLLRLEAEDREQVAAKAVELAYKYKTPVDPNAVKGTSQESLAGKIPPAPPRKMSDYKIEVDPVTGQMVYATTGEGGALEGGIVPGVKVNPKPDYEGVRLARDAARDARTDERDRVRDERDAEKDYSERRSAAIKADEALEKAKFDLHNAQLEAGKKDGTVSKDMLPAYENAVRQALATSDNAWYEARESGKRLQDFGWSFSVKDNKYPNAQRPAKQRGTAGATSGGSVRKEFQRADISQFAKEYFKGNAAEAENYLTRQGYTIR